MGDTNPVTHRNTTLDVFRMIAIFAVIVIHTEPLSIPSDGSVNWVGAWINQFCRFAVPFFFTAAGYLLGSKMIGQNLQLSILSKQSLRLAKVFLFWTIIYLVFIPDFVTTFNNVGVIKAIYWNFMALIKDPYWLVRHGTRIHLWFLVTMIFGLGAIALWIKTTKGGAVVPVILGFYVFGLLGGPYSWLLPDTIAFAPFFPINFFSAVACMLTGWWLAQRRPSVPVAYATVLFFVGMLIYFGEVLVHYLLLGTSPWEQDILVGTIFWIAGIMLIIMAKPEVGKGTAWASWGRFTLGIYAIHLVVRDALLPAKRIFYYEYNVVDIAFPVVVFTVSLVIVMALARLPLTKNYVQ